MIKQTVTNGVKNVADGLIHVYTGKKGSGNTNIVLGLSLRASGAGLKILFIQFLTKDREIAENLCLPDSWCSRYEYYSEEDLKTDHQEIFQKLLQLVRSGDHNMIILDGILENCNKSSFSEKEILKLLEEKNRNTEVILTGSKTSEKIIEKADLVTEIQDGS